MLKQKGKELVRKTSSRDTLRKIREYRPHTEDISRYISDVYVALDTPVSLACYMQLKAGEFKDLVERDIDPRQYNDVERFRDDFAATSLMRKCAGLKTGIDTREVALTTFKNCEAKCKDTNRNLNRRLSAGQIHPADWSVINSQIRKISRILGNFSIDAMLDACGWGKGSTLSIKGENTSSPHKFDTERGITFGAYRLFSDVMKIAYPSWENLSKLRKVAGNTVDTVPKSAKTDRTIAIEPGINLWLQLGLGRSIRKRLRYHGFNLDSDLKNQRGAYTGSITNKLATIDFKAASDTIATSLVELLLPPDWFTVLNHARSPYYTLGKAKPVLSEKFSTMGNGFTFELESLIFVTLGLAVCEVNGVDDSEVSIFGDDLVLPAECVEQFQRVAELFGFTVNIQKSYSTGNFRESCGSYYYLGRDVKPFFIKEWPTQLKDVYRLANALRLFSHRSTKLDGCDKRFSRLWHMIRDSVPKEILFVGPVSAGDAVIHVNPPTSENAKLHPDGWEGFLFPGIPSVAIRVVTDSPGLLLARLHSRSRDLGFGNEVSLRRKVKIVFKKAMFTSQWYDYGPWIPRV